METPAPTETEPTSLAPASDAAEPSIPTGGEPDLVEDELLVEEISIDGMCGVY
ncbi:MAG: mycofactocin precursor MftA [Acidimicrobiia bacterium]|nr:mycofactocin precursor MftA [Acidimicrobiia bacterium]